MMRGLIAIAAPALLCCAAQSDDSSRITLRVGKEWSHEQAEAIASACAESAATDSSGCVLARDGEYAVSRRSDSIKRALVDATSHRRRIIVADEVVEPDDVKQAVLRALHEIHEEAHR